MYISRPLGNATLDTNHVQAALDMGIDTLHFQAGEYHLNTLRYHSNLHLVGHNTTLRKADGGGLLFRPLDVSQVTENVTFENLRIDGNKAGNNDAQFHGIGIYYGRNILITRCLIENCGGDGIYAGRFDPLDGVAIGGDNDGVHILDTVLRGNQRAGCSITRGLNIRLTRVHFAGNNAAASDNPNVPTPFNSASLDIEPLSGAVVQDVIIEHCRFEAHKWRAIQIAGSPSISDLTISGCRFVLTGASLQTIYSSAPVMNLDIVNNTLHHGGIGGGILISYATDDLEISGNRLRGNMTPNQWGIALTKGVKNARVLRNSIRNFERGIMSAGDFVNSGVHNQNIMLGHNTIIGAVQQTSVSDTDNASLLYNIPAA